ncbi:MAG: hypothetical protein LC778_10330 [Acidobacteria bacterium]|nr:hypothetical protein [Acidobacteriota bacterium]
MTEKTKVGNILDMMGVELELAESDQIQEVIVVAKVAQVDSQNTGLTYGTNAGQDWITQQGLLHGALVLINHELTHGGLDDN